MSHCLTQGSEQGMVADQTGRPEVVRPEAGECPLYPQKRTLVERVEMSALCQKQTLHYLYSITSSAMESKSRGTSMPSARAVWRLIMNSNLVDCSTGRSAGLAPLRMLPV